MKRLLLVAAVTHLVLVCRVLADDHDHDAHDDDLELCACAALEEEHPFSINCADEKALRGNTTELTNCGVPSETGCATTKCQVAFFTLFSNKKFCPHDTLTHDEEALVHLWESSCTKCSISRKYEAEHYQCAQIDCRDLGGIFASYYVLNSTCIAYEHSPAPFEWGGIFATPEASYTWVSQAVGSPLAYAHDHMKMVILPTSAATAAALEEAEEEALHAFEANCTEVDSGGVITPQEDACVELHLEGTADTTITIDTSAAANIAIFTEYHPQAFERDVHFLLDADGHEVAAVATEGTYDDGTHDTDADHDHDRRRLDDHADDHGSENRGGSCCTTDAQRGAFRIIAAYHDLCPSDTLPIEVEMAVHEYEPNCKAQFCNAVDEDYDGLTCPSPPPPPRAPSSSDDDNMSTGAIVGIAIASGLAAIFLLFGCLMFAREKQGKPVFGPIQDHSSKATEKPKVAPPESAA